MGHGKTIGVTIDGTHVAVRDFGRGIPLGKLKDCASRSIPARATRGLQKIVGLNGVGIKAVNACPPNEIQAYREGNTRYVRCPG